MADNTHDGAMKDERAVQTEERERRINYMEKPVVLSAEHVSKAFKLPTEQATGLKQAFINWTKGIKGYRMQQSRASWCRSSSSVWASTRN